MTRILSELLGAAQPAFQLGIAKLERASGHPSADIRLSADVEQATQAKLRELGLDAHDTTGPELYAALQERLKADDARLVIALKAASKQQDGDDNDDGDDDVVSAVARALRNVPIPRDCFALKSTVAKQLFRKSPPKKAMKSLGYRSLDSMLKHEPVPAVYAAAWLSESSSWRRSFVEQYKHLHPNDFEVTTIDILNPISARWQRLAKEVVSVRKHNVLGFKELGSVVLLPLPAEQPPVVATVTIALALHVMNEIRAASTFLKLCQVKPDFGQLVQTVTTGEAVLSADVLDRPVPWEVVQRYYARFKAAFRSEIFEPHIQNEDLSWHSVERILAHLVPSMEFWRGTDSLGLLHEHQPVSCNITDVALSCCNKLPFESRIVHYLRHSLQHELMLRYLKHGNVEQAVVGQLEADLVTEPALL